MAEWMRSNRLRLDPEKTDFLWRATRRRCIHLDTAELSVCGALILPSTSVRDLGVLWESDLSMRRQVAWTVGCCFRQLRLIRSCIKSLPLGAAKAAVAALSLRGWIATTACSPALLRASWMDSSRFSMPQRDSSATGGSMTTSHRSSAMFSTGCQSHSASSTSSVYSSFYHFTELLQSTWAIVALGLFPPRLRYVYDHLRGPISGCGG